jgi:hypothetical protein
MRGHPQQALHTQHYSHHGLDDFLAVVIFAHRQPFKTNLDGAYSTEKTGTAVVIIIFVILMKY